MAHQRLTIRSSLVMLLVFASHASAQRIYWTAGGQIHRANLDGSNDEMLALGGGAMALDLIECKMYFAHGPTPKIQRANLDGSQVEDVISTGLGDSNSPWGLALNRNDGKMYWNSDVGVFRANMDGSNLENVLYDAVFQIAGVALDPPQSKLYWTVTDSSFQGILRGPLDGSASEQLITEGLESPRGITVDSMGGKFYWAGRGLAAIQRANLDGSDREGIIEQGPDVGVPWSVALDLPRGKIYWTDIRHGSISRANLDGTEREPILDIFTVPYAVAIDDRVPGDCDSNGVVRLLDHRAFIDCFTGPTVEAEIGCQCADANGDRDVDLADFAAIQNLLNP